MPRRRSNNASAALAAFSLVLALAAPALGGSEKKLLPVSGEPPAPAENPTTPEKVELGKKLFFDRRLSGDGTMSCAVCHDPRTGFSDEQDISQHYPTTKNWRNSPTLINAGFSKFFFHDGRASSLEEQALFPIMSSFEMNQNLDYIEEEIREVPEYRKAFSNVFGDEDTSRDRITMALAAFQRTLVSRNSPLDKYLNGDEGALSPETKAGLEVFKGKGECIECHHGVNLSDDDFHALGVPENPKLVNDPRIAITMRFVGKVSGFENYKYLAEDPGRFLVTKDPEDWKAFKTPTLRELSRTAPYMHNGVFATLDEVIDFFDRGGGPGNKELEPLGLTADEKKALKAFLEDALTGDEIIIEYPEVP